jgi:phospholipid/cholesterol/gamma-HCH transport system ATP-binding protein
VVSRRLLAAAGNSRSDPITSSEIDDLIIRLQEERKMSSMVVTDDLESDHVISDRVALLHEGNILLDGTLKELKTSDNSFVQAFIRRKAE